MTPVPPTAGPLRLSEAQAGAVVTVRPGQAIEVRLADPSPAGPEWSLVKGPPAVVITGRAFAPDSATPPGRSSTDGPGADVIRLSVRSAAGRTVPLSFVYPLSSGRLRFAHVWQVRLRVAASETPARR